MKMMNRILMVIALVALFQTDIVAQVKLGHVNSQLLLQDMPERLEAEKKITEVQQQLEARLQTLRGEYEKKVLGFQEAMQANTPEATLEDMRNEIVGLENRIVEFERNAQDQMMKKNEELLQPMLTKLQDAITAVGKENGYTYIFDLSTGSIVFEAGDDVSELVKAKL